MPRPSIRGPRLGAAVRVAALGASLAGASAARAQEPLVIVVRHAEKAAAPADDPALSAEGEARARALAAALADADVGAVVVTPRRRTAATAAPLAAARGLTPEVVPFGPAGADGVAAHARAVAAAARRHRGGAVLVVGHSNTVPAIVAALGGPRLPDLCDAAYASLFLVRPAPAGTTAPAAPAAPAGPAASAGPASAAESPSTSPRASVVRAQYGRPDPPEAATCAAPPAMR
jgi:broad specificity phosphatase PhoE